MTTPQRRIRQGRSSARRASATRTTGPSAPRVARLLPASLALGALLALSALGVRPAPAAAQDDPSPCAFDARTELSQPMVLLGGAVTVTHEIEAACPEDAHPLHLVLVLDASRDMLGARSQHMKQAAREMVRRLDLDAHPSRKVGVVSFNARAQTLCELTNDTGRVLSCINNVGAGGGRSISAGMFAGLKVLNRGRRVERPEALYEVMIVLASGPNDAGCAPLQRASAQVRGAGVLVGTTCLGPDCDPPCLASIASSDDWAVEARLAADLLGAFERLRLLLLPRGLGGVELRIRLRPELELVPGSVSPPAARVALAAGEIDWDTRVIGATTRLRYAVRPRAAGRSGILASADLRLLDHGRREGVAPPLPDGAIYALDPRPVPVP